jgi:POT family proton-dependent oligopeptide transporter
MWERFSYYGMRAILTLFMLAAVEQGGLGFTTAQAAVVYGIYTSLVYLLPLAGGWLADNFHGLRRAVLFGGAVIMLGHVSLSFHGLPFFYTGLALVAAGTGLLKPNISAMVGELYSPADQRRDAGFSIFYMGINIGAFSAPLVCGFLAEKQGFRDFLAQRGIDPAASWHFGFAAAAVGMFFGLWQYLATGRYLGRVGAKPAPPAEPAVRARKLLILRGGLGGALALALAIALLWRAFPERMTDQNVSRAYAGLLLCVVSAFFAWLLLAASWTPAQRRRLVLVAILFAGSSIFWAVFEQAGSTLTVFAEKETRNALFGYAFPASWWQSVNSAMIIVLAPLFGWLWARTAHLDPSSTVRFSLGLLFAGLGFAVLAAGALGAGGDARVSPGWLFTVYFLHTVGELCLSPVGLSSMTRLAPPRVVGMMLGVWFLSISVGSFLGGSVAGVYERFDLPALFACVAAGAVLMAVVMILLARPARRLVREEA